MRFINPDHMFTVVRLEMVDFMRNHNKFYTGVLDHHTNEVYFWYGRKGTAGQRTPLKKYPTWGAAYNALQKQIASKLQKGYDFVDERTEIETVR